VPTGILVFFDSLAQWTGAWWQLSPSVFVKAKKVGRVANPPERETILREAYFKCPDCGHAALVDKSDFLECPGCGKKWGVRDGIYDFREALR
jgi:hypothetical protein